MDEVEPIVRVWQREQRHPVTPATRQVPAHPQVVNYKRSRYGPAHVFPPGHAHPGHVRPPE